MKNIELLKTSRIYKGISVIGALLSIFAFALFAVVITGTILIIMDSFQTFWVPTLIALSVIFIVMCAVNILLYSKIIVEKNKLILDEENEFIFWTSSLAFWVLPIFFWIMFAIIYSRENSGKDIKGNK
ncbi:MAG: hypothetical protein ACRC1F_02330 [Metamycoplasmataceae bacterium]